MRLIDADALKLSHCKECTLYPDKCMGKDCDWGSIIHINAMPTVDAVPIVRCRDCKYHLQTERNGFVYWSQCNHPHWDLSQGCQLAEVDDTDFCSWAERKEE